MKETARTAPLTYGSRTDVGLVRPHNEDSLVVSPPLFAVADGMGGHEAGEVASEIAIQTLTAQAPDDPDARGLGRAVMAANRAVIHAADNGIGKPGMGTTMTAAVLSKTHLVVAQVGDSRAYLLHHGVLSQITRDHSLMADMIESGQITEEEARWHPQRSVITRALGSDIQTVPDLFDLTLEVGDRILLCSDGLSGMVYDEELAEILQEYDDPQECADVLIDTANDHGGHDNITAIVMDVADENAEVKEVKRTHKARAIVIACIVAFLCICLAAGIGLYAYARSEAYLIDQDGYVTVYRGLPGSVGAIHLSWYETTTNVQTSKLPDSTQQRLTDGIKVDSLDEAYSLVSSYQADVTASSATNGATSTGTTSSTSGSTTSSTSGSTTGTATGTSATSGTAGSTGSSASGTTSTGTTSGTSGSTSSTTSSGTTSGSNS